MQKIYRVQVGILNVPGKEALQISNAGSAVHWLSGTSLYLPALIEQAIELRLTGKSMAWRLGNKLLGIPSTCQSMSLE